MTAVPPRGCVSFWALSPACTRGSKPACTRGSKPACTRGSKRTLHVEAKHARYTWNPKLEIWREATSVMAVGPNNGQRPSPTARCSKAATTNHYLDYDLTIMTIVVLWL